jgi:hypothetical protein
MAGAIEIHQTNRDELARPHNGVAWAIPSLNSFMLREAPLEETIRELLFQIRKDGQTYWVGAAVPEGTTDFTRAQVFFHPTVINGGVVHAADADYPTFSGGWSRSLQRYVNMQGVQLAHASKTTLIVPFMTMASLSGSSAYMFATRPIETLNAIMSAVSEVATGKPDPVNVLRIGASSFSSGIVALTRFIRTFGSSRLILETTDFDSAFIIGSRRTLPQSPGAIARVFSQVEPFHQTPGWTTIPPKRFKELTIFKQQGAHAQIGWQMFVLAAEASALQ